GHFVLNGVAQANDQEIDVSAAQLSQLSYQNALGTDSVQIRVNDGTLWSAWQSFTITSPAVTVIESFGSTKLDQIGSDYFFDPVTGAAGVGPELKYAGAPLAAGTYGAWTILGAEQTASGYDVAFKANGADRYTVWATD